jgi:hypothetical protein
LQNPEKIRKVFRKNLESPSSVTATNGSSMQVRQLQNKFPEGGSGGGQKQGFFPFSWRYVRSGLEPAVQKSLKTHILGHDTAPDSFTGGDTGSSKNKGTVFRK